MSTKVSSSAGRNLDQEAETHFDGELSRTESFQSLNQVTQAMHLLRDTTDESPTNSPARDHLGPPVQVRSCILEQAVTCAYPCPCVNLSLKILT